MIKVENLTRRYGDILAVDGVSFEVGQGEVVGLLALDGEPEVSATKKG